MLDRVGKFAGDDPLILFKDWLAEARATEINDPNAIALSTVDQDGMPNSRIVLLKDITQDGFVFYTNYNSKKAQELDAQGKASFVIHWKSLRRQIRVRGDVTRHDGADADDYFTSRSVASRIGAWASRQSEVLETRDVLEKKVVAVGVALGNNPRRPDFWGGFKLMPSEIEFWADGADRLHDRFRWTKKDDADGWGIVRLNP